MRITILGATGNMGRRVIAEALSRGHDVMGVARNREGLSKLPSSVDAQIGDANRRSSHCYEACFSSPRQGVYQSLME